MFISRKNGTYVVIIIFFIVLPLCFCRTVNADSTSFIRVIEPEKKSELWLNPGMYSYHYDKSQSFNNNNLGFGFEYRYSSVSSVTVGTFKNSDSTQSNYAGIYWQPLALGPVNLGVVAGGFNGYQSSNNGGWFPAIFPAVTIEGKWLGANLFFIPTVGDKVHGALSLQLKVKVMD
jgi:hypothetical protein